MKKKELAAHLDKVGEHLGHMQAKALKGAALSQKEVDALRIGAAVGIAYAAMALELDEALDELGVGAAVGIAYAAMALELDEALDEPGIDAITIVQIAIAELEEVKKHG